MLVEIDGRHQYQYADHRSVEGITQDEDIYKASIFEILRPSKPGSQLESLVTSPDITTSNKTKHSPREHSPKAHYRLVFKEGGQSLHFF